MSIMIKKRIKESGLNLVELMVSMAIFSFILALAVPSFNAWQANMRVRNISESIQFGLLQARSEAIRRNQPILFVLNQDTSWSVVVENDDSVLNKKEAFESSGTTEIVRTPQNSNTITFNGFGQTIANESGAARLQGVTVRSTKDYDGIRELRVRVGTGGTVFICDPTITNEDDGRFCRDV